MRFTTFIPWLLWALVFAGLHLQTEGGETSMLERRQVSARGRIEPEGGVVKVAASYAFSAPQILTELRVKTGDVVKKGQVIATLESDVRLQAALTTTTAHLKLVESRHALALTRVSAGEVEAAEAATAVAQIELEHAECELKRSTHLDQRAAVAQMDIDKWQTEVNLKRKLLDKARHAHTALREILTAEVNAAVAAVAVAQAEVCRTESEVTYGKVLAPCDGSVLKTLLHVGEIAVTPLLELGDTRAMNVIAEVYETDVRFVKVGTPVRITSQALATPLRGAVVSIGLRVSKRDAFSVDPDARTDGRIVEVKVRLADPTLVAGLTNLEVDVVIGLE